MNGKNVSLNYSILQGLYWMSYGVIYSFTTVFLLDRGFTDAQVGTIIALSCIFSALFQPVIASAADRSARFTIRFFMTALCLIIILSEGCLLFLPETKIILAFFYALLLLLHLAFQPLLSALAMHLINHGYQINFGTARGIGSISYAILTFFLGNLTVLFSMRCLPVLAILIYGAIILLLRFFPEVRNHGNTVVSSSGTWSILRTHPRFALLILGIILVFLCHSAINTYMIQVLQKIGKGNTELGQVMAYTALLEFFVMIFFSRITKGRDYGNILKFSAIFFVLKGAFICLAGNLPMIYGALTLQLFSFALFTPASVYYADRILSEGDKVKGQALITIAITIGNILGSFVCGCFIGLWGVTAALWISVAFSLLGLVLFFLGAEKTGAADQPAAAK
ncbi:MFS transporter [Anaerotignum lactatifermentans]|uniref:MFS transporter n=1 Tax=Anaerotignum lactatifermentans TaxID=160404 RepID=A0ABS2GD69_9FIRM|nr:MFS transporter [Anaerotignum lactatifermentans]MBM6830118.1 MFS transporter [Anaerotignum lactatifermentans]MBM6878650.1 MFS transporter [Anaerotignum lactatifermentans]MBM6951715.1 MFS transporter [Anaerotignum lactatifermentans]